MMREKRREEMREGRLEFIARGAIWVCYIVGLRVTVSKATS